MDNGNEQRQMDFVLGTLAEITGKVSNLTDSQIRTDATVDELAHQVLLNAGQIQITTGQVQGIARQQAHINEVIAVMAESQQHTDERLNALIDIVRNGRNSRS